MVDIEADIAAFAVAVAGHIPSPSEKADRLAAVFGLGRKPGETDEELSERIKKAEAAPNAPRSRRS
jgi:hypothetical protein